MPPPSDSGDLVDRAAQGDPAAVHALLERHFAGLQRYLRRRSGPLLQAKESSADLVQSVCREVLEQLRDERFEYRGEAEFKQWLYQAAQFKLENRARYWHAQKRDARRERAPVDSSSRAGEVFRTLCTPSRDAAVKEELARFERAFAELPDVQRQIIVLARIENLAHKEIAQRLGLTEAHSRVLLSRALARLARLAT
jgi:RNA polymerase sigma-70 factor (ECF subfamily)